MRSWMSTLAWLREVHDDIHRDGFGGVITVANMASYAISSSLILVIHDNMIIGTNSIVLACLSRHF
jgi:hypothetical protein